MRPRETLCAIPELDSVVRFEGELALLDLVDALDTPERHAAIPGLAVRHGDDVALAPLRPLVTDLDSLPPVHRDEPRVVGRGIRMASMLASRGCLFACAFCSIRQFYGTPPGALRRARSPERVADEMLALNSEHGVRFFSFQDDDFAARTPQQRAWLATFLRALARRGLAGRVRWKISCRVDDLEPGVLAAMRDHGLMAVYLGVESGSDAGLRALAKRTTVAQSLAAIDLLKRNGIALAIGFMLFEPSSTVDRVRQDLAFLHTVGDDGYFPVSFCKMLPYAGTPMEGELRATGRLAGTQAHPDYAFADPELGWYAFIVQRIFTRRNFHADGVVARLQRADFDRRVDAAFDPSSAAAPVVGKLAALTACANASALRTLEELLDAVMAYGGDALVRQERTLVELAEREWQCEAGVEAALDALGTAGAALHPAYTTASTPPASPTRHESRMSEASAFLGTPDASLAAT